MLLNRATLMEKMQGASVEYVLPHDGWAEVSLSGRAVKEPDKRFEPSFLPATELFRYELKLCTQVCMGPPHMGDLGLTRSIHKSNAAKALHNSLYGEIKNGLYKVMHQIECGTRKSSREAVEVLLKDLG
jgi:hypothetical protein